MATCDKCGEEIEFRYINGRLTPIHPNGWCRGSRVAETEINSFREISSYLNPNARCPVCLAVVYFYQSPHGGRVYFDDFGWPWPKHECTDSTRSKADLAGKREAKAANDTPTSFFYDRDGRVKRLLFLVLVEGIGENYVFHFRNSITGKITWLQFSRAGLDKAGLRVNDLREAPSFVTEDYSTGSSHLQIDFISGRLKKIVKIMMKLVVSQV